MLYKIAVFIKPCKNAVFKKTFDSNTVTDICELVGGCSVDELQMQ
jgi:hypothetical protein